WLRVDRTYRQVNVEVQKDDPNSMISLYRKLIRLRQSEPALSIGEYLPVFSDNQMLAYIRIVDGSPGFLILLNMSHRPCFLRQEKTTYAGEIVISTSAELEGTRVGGTICLSGDEGM